MPVETEVDDDTTHAICGECWPIPPLAQFALCGEYVGGFEYDPDEYDLDEADLCVLCSLTDVCPVCGQEF